VSGIPKQTLGSWARLSEKAKLQGAGNKPVSAEQMELARLRMASSPGWREDGARDIPGNRRRTTRRSAGEVRLDRAQPAASAGVARYLT